MTNNKIFTAILALAFIFTAEKAAAECDGFYLAGAPGMQSMKLMTTEAESETVFPTMSLTRKDLLLPAELVTDTSISEPK